MSWTPPPPPPGPLGPGGSQPGGPLRLGYAVDIVFVIDITGSMGPVLNQVKAGALGFHDRLMATMAAKGKLVNELRLRIVAYRDFYADPSDALYQTPFLRLPSETYTFNSFVHGLHAGGGWDEPESGLEGLAVAMQSDWQRGMDRRRHVIVLFTDASAHPLEAALHQPPPGYPLYIPRSLDALTDAWDDPHQATMEFSAKRLLLYAPDMYPWNIISSGWDNVLHYPSIAGHGLSELEFGQIVDAIAGSV
jgi:hypothetical protein